MNRRRFHRLLANPMLSAANPAGYNNCLRALAFCEDYPVPTGLRLEECGTIILTWIKGDRLVEAAFTPSDELLLRAMNDTGVGGPQADANIYFSLRNSLAWCYGPAAKTSQ